MTLGALDAIRERGLNIPDDISIVGFDDMPWANLLQPPLTAIAQPTYELGKQAAELLLAPAKPGQARGTRTTRYNTDRARTVREAVSMNRTIRDPQSSMRREYLSGNL